MTAEEYEAAYRTYSGEVRKFVERRVDKNDVDDVVQDVFLLAWKKREDLSGRERPIGWLINAAKYKILERGRVNRESLVLMEELEHGISDGELELMEWVAVMERYFSQRECKILLEVCLEGKSLREIAGKEGLSTEGMRWRVNRMKERLKKELGDENGYNP